MRNTKNLLVLAVVGICTLTGLFLTFENNDSLRTSSKKVKKSLIVNGAHYDGPEKFAYYQSAIRTGQADLETQSRYPQYAPFYKKRELADALERGALLRAPTTDATFTERGPANVPGRTRTVILDPEDPNGDTWFAGNVSGGIWKTENAGGTWTEVAPDLANMAIVTMALSEANPSVIYAGTGEGFLYSGTFLLNGEGIYKSIDKGVTWTLLSSTLTDDFRNVSRIIVDPSDENVLLASTTGRKPVASPTESVSSIMRSVDGGDSWTKVYDGTAPVQQIIAAPGDFSIQYAAIRGVGVLRSDDSGLTWNSVSTGLALTGRIELAVSHSDPDRVYGSALGSLSGTGSDLYMTTNGGTSWSLIPVTFNGTAIEFFDAQGWYDNTILVNPFDDDKIYFGGVSAFAMTVDASTSSGDLTVIVDSRNQYDGTNYDGGGVLLGVGVHPDQHFMMSHVIHTGAQEFRIILGNDGGVYVSDPGNDPGIADGSWNWAGADYNTTQFYGADKVAGQEEYLGGTQDNGTWLSLDGEVASISSQFEYMIGGDGFEVVAHYENADQLIGGSQFNGFVATEDRGATVYRATDGLPGTGPFVSRLSNAFQDPDVLFTVESGGVYRSVDWGRNWRPAQMNGSSWGFWNGSDVEVSKADPRIVWAGGAMSQAGTLHVSVDGGLTFDPVPNFGDIGLCTGIYSHPTDENTVFAVFSVADSPKILKSTDLGQTWVDLSGFSEGSNSAGFPDVAVFAVQAMPYNDDVIWAGTEIGLFESPDGGENWGIVDEFPSVTIWDMVIKDGQVVIATHGRGIWTADIPELTGFTAPEVAVAPRISEFGTSLTALEVSMSVLLRSAYDGSVVLANGEEVATLAANTPGDMEEIELEFSEEGQYEIQVVSTIGDIDYFSEKLAVDLSVLLPPVEEYFEDFEEVGVEYAFNGFSVSQPSGFSTKILGTSHPYPTGPSNLIAQLNQPIIVANEEAILKFKEVVHVEEGDEGTTWEDVEFWDYVVVEGSLDGQNWTALTEGYDASSNSNWTGSASSAIESQMVERSIDLLETYNSGDVIILRFRLFTDAAVVGWGWGIDDVDIQTSDEDGDGYNSVQDCDDGDAGINPGVEEIPDNGVDENCDGEDRIVSGIDDAQLQIYPNPVKDFLRIKTDLKVVGIDFFSASGQRMHTHSTKEGLDVSDLPAGIYVVRISTASGVATRKVFKR